MNSGNKYLSVIVTALLVGISFTAVIIFKPGEHVYARDNKSSINDLLSFKIGDSLVFSNNPAIVVAYRSKDLSVHILTELDSTKIKYDNAEYYRPTKYVTVEGNMDADTPDISLSVLFVSTTHDKNISFAIPLSVKRHDGVIINNQCPKPSACTGYGLNACGLNKFSNCERRCACNDVNGAVVKSDAIVISELSKKVEKMVIAGTAR